MADDFDRREMDAAERALGTERSRPASRAEIAAMRGWEETLAPLSQAVPPIAPPPGLYDRILRIITEEESDRHIMRAEREARGSQWLAGMSLAAAALVALAVFLDIESVLRPEAPPARYVAVVTPEGSAQAMVVAVDITTGEALVRPVGVVAPQDRALQLWAIEGDAAPRPLGLISPEGETRLPLEAAPGALIAVSSEPPGGSPTGLPTGDVLFSGPLVAVD